MPTLYLIDGSGYIFRAYHALPPLTDPKGTPVGAVYGFLTMMLRLMEGTRADYVAVVFDAARQTFRNRIYADYKAHRPPPPDDLVPQFALVREAADALSIPRVELSDYEADDLIASYAKRAREAGMEVVILSSDKDLMQLVGEGVRLHDPMKDRPIGEKEVFEKFGVGPEKIRDVLALIGDSSDNVPGVPGIGPKTAAELIQHYGSLEGLLAHAHEIKQPKRRETIEANAAQARLSYELVCLRDDVPLPLPFEAMALTPPQPEKLFAFLEAHGFRSLMLRMREKFGMQAQPLPADMVSSPLPQVQADYTLVRDEEALARWVAEAYAAGRVAVDTETTSLDAMRAELVGLSLSIEPGRACYIPVGHVAAVEVEAPKARIAAGGQMDWLNTAPVQKATLREGQIPFQQVLALLKPLLEERSVLKIGQNIKYDALVLKRQGIEVAPVEDTMLLSYVLFAGRHGHGMDELSERYLGLRTLTYGEVTKSGRSRIPFAEVELERARDYAAEDADVTLRLYHHLRPLVEKERLLTLYETIERPLIPVLVAMEERGVRVDAKVLKELSDEFGRKMAALEQEIHALAGHPFNVGSPKQLGEVLFDEQKLPGGRKSSKTGAYGTDVQVLEELRDQGYSLPAKVLEWRQLAKLKGTYTDALAQQIHPETGRVHTSFAMAVAATGRLSSTDPNLQNIPIRTLEGRKIRRAFIASPGCKLISADYSQIELRLLAHVADIEPLKAAFKRGEDIHATTASQMFGVPTDQVTPELRRRAKTINFGIIYGISAHGLAVRLSIGRGEAAAYIERYFRQYPGIRDYMEVAKEQARRQGYVTTLYGRRCYIPGIQDKNAATRQFSERAAINAPLQGTAADIIKRAMIRIHALLADAPLKCAMLLQVHDELLFEVAEPDAQAALALVVPAMEHATALSVPLAVETGVGDNWGEIH